MPLVFVAALAGVAVIGGGEPSPRPVIAIDIGHGVRDPGAISAGGVAEHVFNRELARVIVAALEASDIEAILINPIGALHGSDGLRARTAAAREAGADLLVSVHHDSVQERYLRPTGQDRGGRFSDAFSGFSLFISSRNPEEERSREFARFLGDALRAAELRPSLHHAEDIPGEGYALLDADRGLYSADFWVLAGSEMPAVLLEAAIIVNPEDEARAMTAEFRRGVADSVVAAVQRWARTADGRSP